MQCGHILRDPLTLPIITMENCSSPSFLTSLSTILNYMLTQITAESTPDVEYFSGKMEQYEVVY